MPHGGCLTCAAEPRAADRQVEILIADTGPGISPDDRRHLFEPFFTTRADGTGLGLALCREIVNNHRGSIEYLARENFGATFRVLLPSS
jgi:two-component system sensor histidine kinase HydH